MFVSELTSLIDSIIDYLERMIEESGMSGDLVYAEILEEDQKKFKEARAEISLLHDTRLFLPLLPNIAKEHIPSLDIKLLIRYSNVLVALEEQRLKELEEDLNKRKNHIQTIEESIT